MLKEKSPLLKLKIKEKKSYINELFNNSLEALFVLYELILEDPIENLSFEIISLSIGYMQIIMFIFNESVSILI